MSKKLQRNLLLVYVCALIIMVIGATYAYFTVIRVSTVSGENEVRSAVTEVISFSIGDPISINANPHNFEEGMGSLTSETYAKAYMLFEARTRVVHHNYNLILDIEKNDFEYSTAEEDAELLLKVIDPNGNEITSIEGLEYVTVAEQSGFDITNKLGNFYIVKDYEIATDYEITHEWQVAVTFVNLNVEQNINYNKELRGNLVMERADSDDR